MKLRKPDAFLRESFDNVKSKQVHVWPDWHYSTFDYISLLTVVTFKLRIRLSLASIMVQNMERNVEFIFNF